MIGEVFVNRYQIKKQLGKRNGRQTLLAFDLNTQSLVVIKFLSFGNNFEWEDLKLFEREAETLKNLQNPAIPRYLNYFEINTHTLKGFALVQAYIQAKNLEEHIHSGHHFTELEVKEIARQLLKILIYIHQQNPCIIHRDIKPSNILLGDRTGNSIGKIYLIDFGSVQTNAAKETGTRTIVGTYGYMPQEQFGGRTIPASDIYSLGATLIYLITGTHPADLPQKDFCIQFEDVASLTPEFTRFLKRMIEPRTEKRLNSAQQTLEILEGRQPNLQKEDINFFVEKPASSKIKLSKSQDYLEIVVPPKSISLSTLFSSLGIIIWNSLLTVWIIALIYTSWSLVKIICILLTPIFISVGIYCLYGFIFKLFGSIYLSLDHQEVTAKEEFFGITLNDEKLHSIKIVKKHQLLGFSFAVFSKHLHKGITKLSYIPKYRIKALNVGNSSNNQFRELDEVSPQITIYSGFRGYNLLNSDRYTFPSLSKLEIEWLIYELSNWLEIPITREGAQRSL